MPFIPISEEEFGVGLSSQGSKFYVLLANDATRYYIAGVSSIGGPGFERTVIDASDITSKYRNKLRGIIDSGQLELELNFVPGDANHMAFFALMQEEAVADFQRFGVEWPNGESIEGAGFVQTFEITTEMDEKITAEVTIECSGAWMPVAAAGTGGGTAGSGTAGSGS